jgi:transposase-like protein
MTNKFTLSQFLREYPDDDKCLEKVKTLRWPDLIPCSKCNKPTKHHKVKDRKAYACQWCGSHVYPLAGTIFDKTSTSLQLWFYAIYLMVQTRAGISAKQLQRELGVTYKTAWRMFNQIRKLMSDSGTPLGGEIEVDETFIGGKGKYRKHEWNNNEKPKEVVMGMLQRKGKVYLRHIPNTGKWTLLKQIQDNVKNDATVYSDEFGGYYHLYKFGYNHLNVNHNVGQFKNGIAHTNSIENFWSNMKRGITGVYRHVSPKYLQNYTDEYGWRHNNRLFGGRMFDLLLGEIAEIKLLKT